MTRAYEPSLKELRKQLRVTKQAYKLIPEYSMSLKKALAKGLISQDQFENAQIVGFKGKDMHEWIMYFTKKIAYLEKIIEQRKKKASLSTIIITIKNECSMLFL